MQVQRMNKERWVVAHKLASDLVDYGTDVNEFGKVAAFMRRYQKTDDAKDRFMLLLQRLANSNDAPIRSGKTKEYYRSIQASCQEHLRDISDADEFMLILGWCMRLMRYYAVEPKRAAEEQRRPQTPMPTPQLRVAQTPQPPKEPEKPKVKIGARVNATILQKSARKVTVQLQTDENEEITFESLYYPNAVGANVKLRVIEVDDTGKIRGVTP